MCVTFHADGTVTTDRSKFSYERFIRELYMHSDTDIDGYWNIDPKIAKDIMLAFGFVPDSATDIGIMIPIGQSILWEPTGTRRSRTPTQFPYTNAMALRLMEWWNRFRSDLCHVEAEIQYGVWS